MRDSVWTLIFLLLFSGITHAAETHNDLSVAKSWIGKYPSALVGNNKIGLLKQPPIKTVLNRILPKAEIAALGKFSSETPVRQMGDFLIVNKCLPHNCPSDMAAVVIDIKNDKLWVGFFSREEARVSTRWYGMSDDYAVLPDDVKQDFLSRHGN